MIARRSILGALAAVIVAARARAQRLPLLGALYWEAAGASNRVEELRKALDAIGYVEGRNIAIEWRWAGGSREEAREAASELARRGVDVLFVQTTPAVHAAKEAAPSTPIVFWMSDPIATGIVSNLVRPGGNLTGVGSLGPELAPKRLEFLRELLPGISRVGFLGSALDPNTETFIRETIAAGERIGVAVHPQLVRGPEEFDAAFARMQAAVVQAVIVQPLFQGDSARVAALQLSYRLPAISDWPQFARDGLLLSFGPDRARMMLRVASYIDRILKGARAGDLPVELPTHFEIIINRRTAAALGIALTQALLIRADEVIE